MVEKKQIVEKSAQLFKNSGIRSNTMDDIARETGISKKTLYQCIPDKNELVTEVIEQEYFKMKAVIEKISVESTNSIEELIRINTFILQFLRTINPTSISDLKKLYQDVYTVTRIRFKELFAQTIIESIKKGKELKIFRDDINEEFITHLHTERIDQMQEASELWGSNSGSSEVIKEMITYYLRGLVTKQGETLLNTYLLDFNNYLNTDYNL